MSLTADAPVENDGKIACAECGARVHIIQKHLESGCRSGMTLAAYKERHPEAPILSPMALDKLKERQKAVETPAVAADLGFAAQMRPMHEVFGLGEVPAAMNARTKAPLMIRTFEPPAELAGFVPDKDPNYVFSIDLLKTALAAHRVARPAYFWGMLGTGKTTIFEQVAAHIGHPLLRVQHTRNTEESHVLGQWVVKDGSTVFQLGPLAFCMKYGLIYLADEYDFAMPAVISLYQPVMEGKALVIKDADPENRVIKPHPNFRFWATGNTNGTGDETGLYQGTVLQNAANYERFFIVEEVRWMEPKVETSILIAQGGVPKELAEKMISFATMCREAYAAGKIGLPPSTRSMINCCLNGSIRADYAMGIRQSYVNRLNRIDQEAVKEVMKRVGF